MWDSRNDRGPMFDVMRKKIEESRQKRDLLMFLAEMDKNLETYYVMEQRQFITETFPMLAWASVKDTAMVNRYPSIKAYAQRMEDFNRSFSQQREFEKWYVGDLANKTPDNARKLHAMKQDLEKQLKGMDAVIIPAGQDLEREMLKLGWLKG